MFVRNKGSGVGAKMCPIVQHWAEKQIFVSLRVALHYAWMEFLPIRPAFVRTNAGVRGASGTVPAKPGLPHDTGKPALQARAGGNS